MLSWTKHENGSATARWKNVWFRVSPSTNPVGWKLTWGHVDMELGMTVFSHRDDAIEEATRLAHTEELELWTPSPAYLSGSHTQA